MVHQPLQHPLPDRARSLRNVLNPETRVAFPVRLRDSFQRRVEQIVAHRRRVDHRQPVRVRVDPVLQRQVHQHRARQRALHRPTSGTRTKSPPSSSSSSSMISSGNLSTAHAPFLANSGLSSGYPRPPHAVSVDRVDLPGTIGFTAIGRSLGRGIGSAMTGNDAGLSLVVTLRYWREDDVWVGKMRRTRRVNLRPFARHAGHRTAGNGRGPRRFSRRIGRPEAISCIASESTRNSDGAPSENLRTVGQLHIRSGSVPQAPHRPTHTQRLGFCHVENHGRGSGASSAARWLDRRRPLPARNQALESRW